MHSHCPLIESFIYNIIIMYYLSTCVLYMQAKLSNVKWMCLVSNNYDNKRLNAEASIKPNQNRYYFYIRMCMFLCVCTCTYTYVFICVCVGGCRPPATADADNNNHWCCSPEYSHFSTLFYDWRHSRTLMPLRHFFSRHCSRSRLSNLWKLSNFLEVRRNKHNIN